MEYDTITAYRQMEANVNESKETNDMSAWITVKAAAALLDIGVHGVRWLIKEDRLEAIKPGRDWLVKRASVEQYKKERDKAN